MYIDYGFRYTLYHNVLSYVIFRKWLLNRYFTLVKETVTETLVSSNKDERITLRSRIEKEFLVCDTASDKYPQNYYSWNHRVWVLETIHE